MAIVFLHSLNLKMSNKNMKTRLHFQSPEFSNSVPNKPIIPFKMDPSIWSRLPLELLELILSLLPLKSLLSLRSTCKLFQSLVFSPSFMSKHSSLSSPSPFSSFLLLFCSHCPQDLYMYDSLVATWRRVSIPRSCSTPSTLLSSSNGLLCFSNHNSSFLVCNILTRSCRAIEYPSYPFTFHLPTLVSTPEGYKIFIHSTTSSNSHAFVYDSRALSWSKFDGYKLILADGQRQEGVYFKGCLYFTTSEPFSIVCFDLERGNWGSLGLKLPDELTFIRLLSDGEGKLFMIGGVGSHGISRSVKLWRMSESDNSWVEVATLPKLMCRKFVSVCYHNYERVYCFWHLGMVCICCHAWPEILYYEVSRRTWHWLPKCPSLPERWSYGLNWFSFVPTLYGLI